MSSQMNQRLQMGTFQLATQFQKARLKHPCLHRNHCKKSVYSCHRLTFFHKHSEKICAPLIIIFLNILKQARSNTPCSHVWWVCRCHPILPCHGLAKVNEFCQFLGGLLHTGAFQRDLHLIVNAAHKPAQQCPVILRHIEDGAVLLGIGEDVQQAFQLHFGGVLFQVRKARPKKLEVSPVDGVALLNGVDVAGVFAVEDAAVVLPCLHHYGKVCQLIGTVVNVQTVEVVFQNALGGIPLAVTHAFVDLHQHVKGIDQNMPGTHAGIDKGQAFRV